jgi:hypothetical protein
MCTVALFRQAQTILKNDDIGSTGMRCYCQPIIPPVIMFENLKLTSFLPIGTRSSMNRRRLLILELCAVINWF